MARFFSQHFGSFSSECESLSVASRLRWQRATGLHLSHLVVAWGDSAVHCPVRKQLETLVLPLLIAGVLSGCSSSGEEFRVYRRYTTCTFVDVDADGDSDLFLGHIAAHPGEALASERDDLFLNNGSGEFELAKNRLPVRSGGITFGSIASEVADLNGDGAPDLILSRVDDSQNGGGGIQLLVNDGEGSFSDISAGIPQTFDQSGVVDWADPVDFDGDGLPDLAVSVGFPQETQILRNAGDGTFVTHREHEQAGPGGYGRLLAGDLNDDGKPDIVFIKGGEFLSQIHFLENSSTGPGSIEWTNREMLAEEIRSPDGALLDWDHDGDLDLILTDFIFPPAVSEDGVRLYRNDGDFVFVDVSANHLDGGPVTMEHPRIFVVADFDGDGADDLFVADHGLDQEPFAGTQNRLLMQTSEGTISEESESRMGVRAGFTHAACAADVDGDGDQDLVTSELTEDQESGVILSINDGTGHFTEVRLDVPSTKL